MPKRQSFEFSHSSQSSADHEASRQSKNQRTSSSSSSSSLIAKANVDKREDAPKPCASQEDSSWSFSSQPDKVKKFKKVRKIQIGASLGPEAVRSFQHDYPAATATGNTRSSSSSSRKQQRQRALSKSTTRKVVLQFSDDDEDDNGNHRRQEGEGPPSSKNHRRGKKNGPLSLESPWPTTISRGTKQQTQQPSSSRSKAETRPSNSRRRSAARKNSSHKDGDFSSDSEEEVPYSQNLGLGEAPSLAKQLAALEADDSDNEGGPRCHEPVRPGDVIAYYHPAFVYGNPAGHRVTQVLATFGTPVDGRLLDLDNAEFLPPDTRVRRVGEYKHGNVLRHFGLVRQIRHYRLRTRRLPEDTATGLTRQVERMRQHVMEVQEAAKTMPPSKANDDEAEETPKPSRNKTKTKTATMQSNNNNVDDDATSSDDSLVKELLGNSSKQHISLVEMQKSPEDDHDEEATIPAFSNENTPNGSQSSSSVRKEDSTVSENRPTSVQCKKRSNLTYSPSQGSSFSMSRVGTSSAARRPPLSTVKESSKQSPAKDSDSSKVWNLEDSDNDSDDDLLLAPIFGEKKSQKSSAKTKKTSPAKGTTTAPAISSAASRAKPPRPAQPRSSFGVKDIAQRRAHGWSEKPATWRQAEAVALDASDDDDALSVTSTNRQMRHRLSHKKKKKKKSSAASSSPSPPPRPEKSPRLERPSLFRPTQIERADDHVYGVINSSDEEEPPPRSRFRNPITRSDDSIGSFPTTTKTTKRGGKPGADWLKVMRERGRQQSQTASNNKARSSSSTSSSKKKKDQSGPMRLSFETVNHSEGW